MAAAPGPPAYGSPRLISKTDIGDKGSPSIEESADFNGDGSVDLYVGNIYTDAQKIPPGILLNDGAGRFTECGDCLPALMRGKITVPWHPRPLDGPTYAAAEFVDVDGNGTQDLALGGNGFYRVDNDGVVSSDNQLLLNDGNGRFRLTQGSLPPRAFGNTSLGYDVRAGDLTRDGRPDLIFAYTKTEPMGQGRSLQVLVNNGDGTFRDETAGRLPQTDNDAPTFVKYLRLFDFNGDGALDIVGQLVEGAKDAPPTYLNNGQGVVHGASRRLRPHRRQCLHRDRPTTQRPARLLHHRHLHVPLGLSPGGSADEPNAPAGNTDRADRRTLEPGCRRLVAVRMGSGHLRGLARPGPGRQGHQNRAHASHAVPRPFGSTRQHLPGQRGQRGRQERSRAADDGPLRHAHGEVPMRPARGGRTVVAERSDRGGPSWQ